MKTKAKVAIFVLSMVLQSANAMALVISSVTNAFPDASVISVQMVYTLITLMTLVGTVVSGKLASITTKKNLVVIFTLVTFVGAMVGYFFGNSLPILYVSSVLMGLGTGLLVPITSALIAEIFEGGERATVNGLQSLFVNGGAILINMVAGMLVASFWKDIYLTYFIMVPVCLVCLFLLPQGKVEKAEKGEKVKLFTPFVIVLAIQAFLLGISWTSFMSNATYYVFDLGVGNESQASMLTMAQFGGAVLIGLVLRPVMQKTGKYCFVAASTLAAIGLWVLCFSTTLPALVAGSLLLGLGFGLFMPSGFTLIPNNVHPAAVTFAIAIFTAALSLGGFINPYIITAGASLIDNAVSTRFILAAALQTVNVVVGIVVAKKLFKDEQASL